MNSVVYVLSLVFVGFSWFGGSCFTWFGGSFVLRCFSPAEQSTTGSPYWDDGIRDRVVLAHLISLSNHFCDTFENLPLKTGRLGSFGSPFCCITVD